VVIVAKGAIAGISTCILSSVPIKTIYFDLDDTLYRKDSGLWQAMLARIERYMLEEMHIPAADVPVKRKHYLETFGTSLRGLMNEFEIDPENYLTYVHDVPVESMLKLNPTLNQMLSNLPQRKWIFTNSSEAHSQRVLDALGIRRHFEGVIDVKAMGYRSKPDAAVYQLAVDKLAAQPSETLFVDDSLVNLQAAKALGAYTTLVGDSPHAAVDHLVANVEDLVAHWPELVESKHAR
jgi:putative hydrolase of the HAD superfamily